MADKTRTSFLPLISILVVLLAITGQAVAGRSVPTKDDKKQPEWFIGHDGSYLIPGIGRVLIPPLHNVVPQTPFPNNGRTGSTGGSGSGETPSTGHDYVPGGDDTFVPNPGYEVPIPGNGAGNTQPTPTSP
ncbi:PREDICTED: putative cell [Prunus dulcis]|uniref:PREDICTED: putative cell n=1 Tax=Prunus dulcis TaxID=3755 RepID=A0A5E4FK85_PRUDU|nr:putative cell wall protein [Prunus dulcis]KAI5340532.1 hypothetical protein L3X38_019806 [Prunus dulcis]VVA27151.1 PREDICTED: putative cell [Prunus dulcis]